MARSLTDAGMRLVKTAARGHRHFFEFPVPNESGVVRALLVDGGGISIRTKKSTGPGDAVLGGDPYLIRGSPLYLYFDLNEPRVSQSIDLSSASGFAEFLDLLKCEDGVPAACWDLVSNAKRLRSWKWCAASAVRALCDIGLMDSMVRSRIVRAFLDQQIAKGPCAGGFWVRRDYSPIEGVLTVCAPNDCAYIGYHALLPCIAEAEVRQAADKLYSFIGRVYRDEEELPSRYCMESQTWNTSSHIVDEIFVLAFLSSFERLVDVPKSERASRVFEKRLLPFYETDGPFFFKELLNGKPERRSRYAIFTRGQAWAMEGLIEANKPSGRHTERLAAMSRALIERQNADGSWNYDLSKPFSGVCGKATPIIAFQLHNYARECGKISGLRSAVDRAFQWGERSIKRHGCIVDSSSEGTITGVKGHRISFLYANSYHIRLRKRLTGMG